MGCGSSQEVVLHQVGSANPAYSNQPHHMPGATAQKQVDETPRKDSIPLPSAPRNPAPLQEEPKPDPSAPPLANGKDDKDAGQQVKENDKSAEVPISEDDLKKFIEFELEIKDLEKSQCEERLGTNEVQLGNLKTALKEAESNLSMLRQNTQKEKQDVVEFNIAQYMMKHGVTMMAPEDALKKEEQEYIDAKNKQDVAEKQVEGLHNRINTITKEIETLRKQTQELNDLRQKVDGLLENIFNDEYGSELEARLELESEQLLSLKQRISVAHYKWHNGKILIHHACLQLAFAKRRWEQIRNVDPQYLQAKYQMTVEVRSNLIAAHQNLQQTKEYLGTNFHYFNAEDSKNLLGSINSIFLDVLTVPAFERALSWYKYYHYKSALLLNWMDQTIKNRIITDHKDVSRKFHMKYKELRAERFRCIKERAKQDLGLDLDLGELEREDTEERIECDVTAKESSMAVAFESSASSDEKEAVEGQPPPPESQENAMEVPEPPKKDEAGPPEQEAVPLSELAPPPSSEELFGDIEELKQTHKQQIEEFEKAQSLNRTRMDQGLQEKLRARRSKRIKHRLHAEQISALSKKQEVIEEPVAAVEDTPTGGEGNPDVVKDIQKNEAEEETIVPANEVPLGGDGNQDVLKSTEANNN